jgi:hypothetical protein
MCIHRSILCLAFLHYDLDTTSCPRHRAAGPFNIRGNACPSYTFTTMTEVRPGWCPWCRCWTLATIDGIARGIYAFLVEEQRKRFEEEEV